MQVLEVDGIESVLDLYFHLSFILAYIRIRIQCHLKYNHVMCVSVCTLSLMSCEVSVSPFNWGQANLEIKVGNGGNYSIDSRELCMHTTTMVTVCPYISVRISPDTLCPTYNAV